MGTPLYMAPEQATGGALDGRADEYALAVVAFELLSGRVPFIADSPLAVLHQQVTAPPPPLSTVLPGSPAAADTVLAKALAKKADERYATCGAFVRALGDALGVPSAAATVPQAVPPAAPDAGSQLRTVVSRDFGAPPLAAPASVPPKSADPSRSPKIALAAILALSAAGGAYFLMRGTARPGASSEVPASPTPGISSSVKEGTPAPVVAAPTTSASATATSEVSSKVNEPSSVAPPASSTSAGAPAAGGASAAAKPRPHSPLEENLPGASRSADANSSRPAAAPVRPKQTSFPPLLSGAGFSGDTQLSAAWQALDTHGRSRLTREDFVDAMGAAREVLGTRPTAEVRFLDAYARAGVAYADGRNAEAWQLLTMALRDSGPAADTRVMAFVAEEVHAMGPNPGPDAEWVMGLAFGDVRGELRAELDKAQERAPRSPRVREAREVSGR
jgi:serine/threonine protein kinase